MTVDPMAQQATFATSGMTPSAMPGVHVNTAAQARKAGQQFEAMFVTQMLQHMFDGLKTDGWFDGGQAEQMFRPMLLEQYGKLISQHGRGIGIADAVARTLLHTQEVHG